MGIAERKEREKRRRKNEIIDAAERVFFRKGFDLATMEDIAEDAELSKATLYLYFHKKTELCLAITVRSLRILRQMLENVTQSGGSGIDKFQQLADVYLQFYQKHLDYFNMLANFRNHGSNCDAESSMMDEICAQNDQINQLIATVIEQGIDDHTIRNDIDSEKIAYALWGQLSGLMPNIMTSIGMTDTVNRIEKFNPFEIFHYLYNLIKNSIANPATGASS